MSTSKLSMHSRYVAAMVLAGVGDAMGYKGGQWEFNKNGAMIHKEVQKMGGVRKIKIKKPDFIVSDDTVMHLATGEALVKSEGLDDDQRFDIFAQAYIVCMNDMSDRGPGMTCMSSCHWLNVQRQKGNTNAFRIPFNQRGGGCGGSMRTMCIGLRYPLPSQLDELIKDSIESSRITHHHPTGFLGGLTSALFTSYAIHGKPINSWGSDLVKNVLPKAKDYIRSVGVDVEDNLNAWNFFESHWSKYLKLRGIESGTSDPVFPEEFDVEARDVYYKEISFSGWGGSAGHDSTIIAYDALMGCKGSWDELCYRATFHGGDSDSTGTIASCWFGALYGMDKVYPCNHESMEYRDRMVELADKLYNLSGMDSQSD